MVPEQNILDELVRRIVKVASPRRIILFGSAARGDMREDSDLDVLVVVPEGVSRLKTAQELHMNFFGLGVGVDVVVATEKDLEEHGGNFSLVYYPAIREGKEIYAA